MMKDKLTKYNHKTAYYVFRKTVVAFSLSVAALAAISIPTTINLLQTQPKPNIADQVSSEDSSSDESGYSLEIDEENVQQTNA